MLEGLPRGADGKPGPIVADAPKIVLPNREKMKTEMEALIHHFKIVTEGFAVPAGEVYQAVESPRGEMGYYVVSDGTAKPYRVHMRNPVRDASGFGNHVQGETDVVAAGIPGDDVQGTADRGCGRGDQWTRASTLCWGRSIDSTSLHRESFGFRGLPCSGPMRRLMG
jgi:hypothetical protein